MGTIEAEAKKKRLYTNVRHTLLAAVALTGVVLVATIAPNAPAVLSKLPSFKRAKLRYQYKTALGRLAAQGHVVFEKRDGKQYARITESGRKILAFEQEKAKLSNAKKKRWNRRWRVVIFDVPEKRRQTRDRLRKIMERTGFARLQDSVWVFPYDCEDFIALLKAELKIGAAVLYMVVEHIENDKHLRAHFGLK